MVISGCRIFFNNPVLGGAPIVSTPGVKGEPRQEFRAFMRGIAWSGYRTPVFPTVKIVLANYLGVPREDAGARPAFVRPRLPFGVQVFRFGLCLEGEDTVVLIVPGGGGSPDAEHRFPAEGKTVRQLVGWMRSILIFEGLIHE